MLGRSTNRLLPPSLLLAAAVLFPSPAPGQTTWKLKEIKYTNEQKKMGPNEAVGRGPDFVKWTPTASPFPPPSTLRLGDTVSLSLDASYQYGAGDDGSQTGRPKQGWIEVSVLGQTDSKRVDLVQNTCRWKVPPDLPPNMPKSGSLKASKSVAITEAFKDAKALTISGHVSFNIYCWEGEAHGSSGFRATYEKVPGGPIAGAPSGDNEAPTVSLTANHADLKYFEGEKVILDADARDDKDRPDQMSYTWEVVNLDTGGSRRKGPTQNWRRLTQEISVKTPPRDKTVRFRFKVTVTDRQGAQGEASVEIELLKPDITQLEFQNSSKNFVAEYLSNGLKVCRRGQYFAVDVHLENISAKHHTLRLFIDGQRVQAGEANESDWVILKRGWKDPRKVYRLVVFVPPAVPVGEHKVDVSIIRKSDEAELDKEPLAPDPFVLFNPFSRTLLPDASVRKPNPIPESLAHSYTLGAQDYYFYPGSTGIVPRPVTVTPFDPSVFKAAKEFVMGMPKPARADAVSVADFFVRKVYGEMLSGNWSENYAGGLAPWVLASKGAPFIARQYLDHGKVKFAQCFVYGQMVTALLRSVGIPTRTLTNEGSGHDSRAPWGALLNYFDRSGKPTKVYEVWNFHVWNEAWIPALSPAGGWVLLDATGQSRASDSRADSIVAVPSRDSVPAVAELPEGRQYSDGQDDVFVFTECNLRSYNAFLDCDLPCTPFDPTKVLSKVPVSRRSAWAAYVELSGSMSDEIAAYRPRIGGMAAPASLLAAPSFWAAAVPPPPPFLVGAARSLFGAAASDVLLGPTLQTAPPPASGVRVDIPEKHALFKPLRGRVEISGLPSDAPAKMMVMLQYLPREANGGASAGDAVAPPVKHFRNVDILPSGGNWRGEIDIPAEAFDTAGAYKLAVGLHDVEIEGCEVRIYVQGMPLDLDAPKTGRKGEPVLVKAGLTNVSGEPLRGVTLSLSLPPSWKTTASTEAGPRDLGPGERLEVALESVPGEAGKFRVHAEALTPLGPAEASAEVVISGPLEIVLDAIPVSGARVGSEVGIEVSVMNDGAEALSGLDVGLAPVDGVDVIGDGRQALPDIPAKGRRSVSWKVKPSRKGVFELPVTANGPGGAKAEEKATLTAGGDDPDELDAPPAETAPPLPPGAGVGDLAGGPGGGGASSTGAGVDDFVPAGPSEPATALPPGSGAAGGGGGGGGMVLPRADGASPLWVGILVLAAAVIALAALLAARRRIAKPAPAAGIRVDLLIEVAGPDGPAKSQRFDRAPVSVGRAPENDLVLLDPLVSRRHFEIRVEEGRMVVVDLGSSGGTAVDGRPAGRAAIYRGSVIRAGGTTLRIL